MDLTKFDGLSRKFDEGVEIEIRHPVTNEPLGMKVRVASYQSERVKKVQRKLANAALRDQKRNPKKPVTVEETEEKAFEIVAAAVLDWSGFERDGEALACTPENVLSVIENSDLWFISEQIDKAADDQAAFFTN